MTHISTQPQSLTFVPVQLSVLDRLESTLKKLFRSYEPSQIDTAYCSDHTLRDLGADRSHQRQHPSTMGRMF